MMACKADRPMWEEMLTFAWEKPWIWHNPVPALPMICLAITSGMAMVVVMQSVGCVEVSDRILVWGGHLLPDDGIGAGS